jgi:hypothetical protein
MRIHSRGKAARKQWSFNAHAAKARKRMAGPQPEREPARIAPGTLLGTLRWHGVDGSVTQCAIRQGKRANGIRIGATECGWDTLLRRMRSKLSIKKLH